nr:uncharacterized protein C6orf10-like [Microcebus murinus]
MAVLEITLAVILTLLGLAILAILLTRWTRRKQSEIYVSRYSSEQSAGLLDCEDGLQYAYSTESDTSYNDQEGSGRDYTPSTNSLALSRSTIASSQGSTSSIKCLKKPLRTSRSTAKENFKNKNGRVKGRQLPLLEIPATLRIRSVMVAILFKIHQESFVTSRESSSLTESPQAVIDDCVGCMCLDMNKE